jgi:hypothetical protein
MVSIVKSVGLKDVRLGPVQAQFRLGIGTVLDSAVILAALGNDGNDRS